MSPADPVDDYVPGHGDLSYDVCHYDLSLEYRVETNALLAKATLSAVALKATDRVVLDLEGLRVSKVLLDGTPVRFTHRAGRLVVKAGTRLRAGQEFRVQVAYQGMPLPVHGIDGEAGWEELSDGVIVASQPHGAPSWFPCNDRPSNKASYRIKVATESAYHVTANGSLVDQQAEREPDHLGVRPGRAHGDLPRLSPDRAVLRAGARHRTDPSDRGPIGSHGQPHGVGAGQAARDDGRLLAALRAVPLRAVHGGGHR